MASYEEDPYDYVLPLPTENYKQKEIKKPALTRKTAVSTGIGVTITIVIGVAVVVLSTALVLTYRDQFPTQVESTNKGNQTATISKLRTEVSQCDERIASLLEHIRNYKTPTQAILPLPLTLAPLLAPR